MAAAPADLDDDPAGSSSHNKGGDKNSKDKQPKGAESRIGSSRHCEAGNNRGGHQSRERKEDPRKEKAAPPHQERRLEGENPSRRKENRDNMPPPLPPPPRKEGDNPSKYVPPARRKGHQVHRVMRVGQAKAVTGTNQGEENQWISRLQPMMCEA